MGSELGTFMWPDKSRRPKVASLSLPAHLRLDELQRQMHRFGGQGPLIPNCSPKVPCLRRVLMLFLTIVRLPTLKLIYDV